MATTIFSSQVAFEPVRSLAFGSISGTYAAIGSGLSNPSRQLIIMNLTNGLMTFSFDGVTDHLVLPANGPIVFDFVTNKAGNNNLFVVNQGTIIWVKGSASSGAVYVSSVYGGNF